jgi:mannose-6-phosphate isomerase-like protein (cupin superfamily)
MKYVTRKSEAKKLEEHSVSVFSEYQLPFNNFAVGVSEIKARYPQTGFDIDSEINQAWYVIKGSGKLGLAEQEVTVNEGDLIAVPRATKFFIDGQLTLVVVSNPPWSEKQHQHIEE